MEQILELRAILIESAASIGQQIVLLAPRILAAITVLVLGALLAKLIEVIIRGTLRRVGFETLLEKLGVTAVLGRISTREPATIAGRLVYWVLILLLLQAAAEVLGLRGASDAVRQAAGYLPNLLGALALVIFGIFASGAVGRAVARAAEPLGRFSASALSRTTSVAILVIIGIMVIGQLEIRTAVLQAILLTLVIGATVTMALTLGLGSREITRNMLAGFYARKLFRSGDEVQISGEKGTLVSISPIQTIVETRGGLKAVPNDVYLKSVVEKKRP
ncbi:mechanosensitive ion channel family protein [bacterium]|nr:mechanosensitive ion channel family protein [bacterium]